MNEGTCVKIENAIESNIYLIDVMLFNESINNSNGNILITDSRDVTFELKNKGYNKSYPIVNYVIDERQQNTIKKSGIKTVYLYENENINEISLYCVNQGFRVYILKDVNGKSIVRMTSKELDRFCTKSISYYKYWLTKLMGKYDISSHSEILESHISDLFFKLNFNSIDNEQFDQFLGQDIFTLQDNEYNPLLYHLIKKCMIFTLQNRNS